MRRVLLVIISILLLTNINKTSAQGCTPMPVADFSANSTTAIVNNCQGTNTAFLDKSTISAGNIEAYIWDFGNDDGATAQNPSYGYPSSGGYTVKLTVISDKGCVATISKAITVYPAPVPDFIQTDVCLDNTMNFTENSAIASGYSISNFSWNFGDGIGNSSSQNPSYLYLSSGTFPVELTTTSNMGCAASKTVNVTVNPKPIPDFSSADVCLGNTSSFTNLTEISSGGLSYKWKYGNGAIATSHNGSNIYSSAGSYIVRLEATSEKSCFAYKEYTHNVKAVPAVNFTISNKCNYDSVIITNTSSIASGTLNYAWDLGDGTTTISSTGKHKYDYAGSYLVKLTATSNLNCSNYLEKTVNIYEQPRAMFSVANICEGNNLSIDNTSYINTGAISHQNWNFGNGSTSTDLNPLYSYSSFGSYNLQLTVESEKGCKDTLVKIVEVYKPTIGGSIIGSSTACILGNTGNLSVSGKTGKVIRWEYSYTGQNPWSSIEDTSSTLNYQNLLQTTHYRAVVQNGSCSQVNSAIGLITINTLSDAGSISGENLVCEGINNGNITVAGFTGAVSGWLEKIGSGAWTPVGTSSSSYSYTNLSNSRYFKAIVKNGVCENDTTNSFLITVSPSTIAGIVSGAATHCEGANNGAAIVSGKTGKILRWESSATGNEPWSTMADTTSVLGYTNLNSSSWFRAVVQSPGCSIENSNSIKISIDKTTIKGRVIGNSSVCSKVNSGTLSVIEKTGAVEKWQYSYNGLVWNDTAVTSENINFSNLNVSRYYKAVVKSGVCSSTISDSIYVKVNQLPVVNFSAADVCRGTNSSFVNNSTVNNDKITLAIWDFGDTGSSSVMSPVHRYESYGDYSVKLKITTSSACQDSITKVIKVLATPNASFSQSDVCLGNQMSFINSSTIGTGNIASYSWAFGDNTASTLENPTKEYLIAGSYNAILTVTSDKNCSSSFAKNVKVSARAVVDFTSADICHGTTSVFVNNSFSTAGNLTYSWSFGDGNTSTLPNPFNKYEYSGTYNVTLNVNSTEGCSDSKTKSVLVKSMPKALFTAVSKCLYDSISFSNLSTLESGTLAYSWDFGDGTLSTIKSPTRLFSAPGSYPVALTATSDQNCVANYNLIVKVYPVPDAGFTIQSKCEDESVKFQNNTTISNGKLTYKWFLNNQLISEEMNPIKDLQFGNYNVKLITSSPYNCLDSLASSFEVYALPKPKFTFANVCDGLPVKFANSTTIPSGTVKRYEWDFGDQTNSIVKIPIKQYLNPGKFPVVLRTVSDKGCTSEFTDTVSVYSSPVADFSYHDECFGTAISFQNTSLSETDIIVFDWTTGDGKTHSLASFDHLYKTAGLYPVKLKVRNLNGCIDSLKRNVQVYSSPVVYAGLDTTVSRGYSIKLHATGAEKYFWSPSQFLDNNAIQDPVATPLTNVFIKVQGVDKNGCKGEDSVFISVTEDYRLRASNVLTPDGNNSNDSWVIENIDTYTESEVFVYDRNGKLVYTKKNYQNDWKGTRNNELLPDGTYYYVVKFDGSDKIYKGALTILRNR